MKQQGSIDSVTVLNTWFNLILSGLYEIHSACSIITDHNNVVCGSWIKSCISMIMFTFQWLLSFYFSTLSLSQPRTSWNSSEDEPQSSLTHVWQFVTDASWLFLYPLYFLHTCQPDHADAMDLRSSWCKNMPVLPSPSHAWLKVTFKLSWGVNFKPSFSPMFWHETWTKSYHKWSI